MPPRSTHPSRGLERLQSWFFGQLQPGAVRAAGPVLGTPWLSARRRVDIYADMYQARLVEALSLDFPRLSEAMTPPRFERIALAYLKRFPSRRATIQDVGARLPGFLKSALAAGKLRRFPFAADLARLERIGSEVYVAPGDTGADAGEESAPRTGRGAPARGLAPPGMADLLRKGAPARGLAPPGMADLLRKGAPARGLAPPGMADLLRKGAPARGLAPPGMADLLRKGAPARGLAPPGMADLLRKIRPQDWPNLRFAVTATLRMVRVGFRFPVRAQKGAKPVRQRAVYRVYRRGLDVFEAPMDPVEARALAWLQQGHTFGEVCVVFGDAATAATALATWVDEGLLLGLTAT